MQRNACFAYIVCFNSSIFKLLSVIPRRVQLLRFVLGPTSSWFLLRFSFVLVFARYRSTSPPGGNQVDGLPPALRWCSDEGVQHTSGPWICAVPTFKNTSICPVHGSVFERSGWFLDNLHFFVEHLSFSWKIEISLAHDESGGQTRFKSPRGPRWREFHCFAACLLIIYSYFMPWCEALSLGETFKQSGGSAR